jgi:rhomboid protease GluP
MARLSGAARMEKGAVAPQVDTQVAHSACTWQVHFLFGQGGSWGEPKSQWKWIGKGELSVERHSLNIAGKRHRYFWFAAKQAIRVELHQVFNVVAEGRLVKFEVKLASLEGERREIVRLRTSDAQEAQAIALALPTTRSPEFERAHHEKLSFDRSMEQLGTQTIVTWGLVAANISWVLYVASQGGGWLAPQPGVIIHWGSNYGPLTLNGEWWRLFTCMFVHFGLLHLAFNMWVLWSIGRMVERMFGSLHYLLLYVFAGLCGSMASLWWQPNVHSAGASGAIFGLLGGLLAFVLNPASGVPPTIVANQRRIGLAFIAYNLINGFTHHGIDNAAHLGGLVGGFVMGWILARPLDVTAREEAPRRFALAAVLGFASLLALGKNVAQLPHLSPNVALQQNTSSNRIEFYPGRYRRVVLDSGEKVSAAMEAVHAASDTTSLNTAIAVVQHMIDAGNAEAAFRLGRYYHLEASEPDYANALKYYQLAFAGKHAWATNNLGLLYRDGLGVPRNLRTADDYFRKAAAQHNPWAYINLAERFGQGKPSGSPVHAERAGRRLG